MTPDAAPCIAVRDLTVRIGGSTILDTASFSVPRHAITVLLGDAGAGTSTAVKVIAGLESARGGTIEVDGRDVTKLRAGRRNVALVFDGHALFPHMSVFENVAYPLRVAKLGRDMIEARVTEVARLLDFAHVLERRPREVSEGLKRRAGLARAIVREPAVYLFDRALASLDDEFRGAAREVIGFLRERFDATIIMPIGDGAEAKGLADWLVVMADGRVLQEGVAAELRAAPASLDIAARVAVPPFALRDGGIVAIEPEGLRVQAVEGPSFLLSVVRGDAEIGERVTLAVAPAALKLSDWDTLSPDALLLFDADGIAFSRRA
ncbi:MAG: ABC transporter ATP-binding protein [Alphaproteobacteria bacterium]|nr:ABC transporter ATP-binding protein [Alphaproteobacteria bacterium]